MSEPTREPMDEFERRLAEDLLVAGRYYKPAPGIEARTASRVRRKDKRQRMALGAGAVTVVMVVALGVPFLRSSPDSGPLDLADTQTASQTFSAKAAKAGAMQAFGVSLVRPAGAAVNVRGTGSALDAVCAHATRPLTVAGHEGCVVERADGTALIAVDVPDGAGYGVATVIVDSPHLAAVLGSLTVP